jgi:Uma2 family endonuclease
MSTAAIIPIEEYLATSYRPDCDYVDGEVQERNLGEFEHATLQGEVYFWFRQHAEEWGIRVLPEMRLRVSESSVRIPDVTVMLKGQPIEKVATRPPFLLIEILSPEDRLSRMRVRVNDYLAMGVQHVWLLDPETREAYRCTVNGFEKASELSVAGTPLYLPLPQIFAALDVTPEA